MEELLERVLQQMGKSRAEFEREVDELKDQTDAAKALQSIQQQQAETSAILLEFIEAMTGGV